ncbi:MAG: hypothetical protein Q8N94_07035 [Methanoregula sp.]|nr:hypothetical protein [Methanoregula sp.]
MLTMGGMGGSALHQLDGLSGSMAAGSLMLHLPSGCRAISSHSITPQGKKKEEILTLAQERIGEIAGMIDKGLITRPGISPLSSLLKHFTYAGFIFLSCVST